MENIVELIKKVQDRHPEDSFEVSNISIFDALPQEKSIKIIYEEEDLTKNFVKFSTDLLSSVYGNHFMEDVIKSYGEVLKTNKEHFKESYRNKPSSIKEILPSVFIHTSMSKVLMESLIVDLVTKARLSIKFFNVETTKTEKNIFEFAMKYKNVTEFSKKSPREFSAAQRLGLLGKIQVNYGRKMQREPFSSSSKK